MKTRMNRILMISMLIGFCISSTNLKSQMIQSGYPCLNLLETDTQYTLNNWFSLDYYFEADWSSEKNNTPKGDSLKNKLDIKSKMKSSKDSAIQMNRSSLKKIRKKTFRNKTVIIQTRI